MGLWNFKGLVWPPALHWTSCVYGFPSWNILSRKWVESQEAKPSTSKTQGLWLCTLGATTQQRNRKQRTDRLYPSEKSRNSHLFPPTTLLCCGNPAASTSLLIENKGRVRSAVLWWMLRHRDPRATIFALQELHSRSFSVPSKTWLDSRKQWT